MFLNFQIFGDSPYFSFIDLQFDSIEISEHSFWAFETCLISQHIVSTREGSMSLKKHLFCYLVTLYINWLVVLFMSSISLLIFCLLALSVQRIIEIPHYNYLIVYFSFHSVSFCFMYFVAVFSCYPFTIVKYMTCPTWSQEIFSKVYSVQLPYSFCLHYPFPSFTVYFKNL